MSELGIEINQLPPASYSLNSRVHWSTRWKDGVIYQNAVYYEAVNARNKVNWQALEYALMELEFVFAVERIRDEDNHRARMKPGVDALVKAGIILYDDLKHLTCSKMTFTVSKERAPMTIIKIKAGG